MWKNVEAIPHKLNYQEKTVKKLEIENFKSMYRKRSDDFSSGGRDCEDKKNLEDLYAITKALH